MRLLAGAEAPDAGTRREGHQVVMQYFAQDEANRLEPGRTVYETMQADSPVGMVPMIRNILGGFLFSGDDIYKRAGVLSGGERTRLAVARMLLRPANTLLLDEPTNHLDLDSKDVLLEALEDFGGTLIFVSHDRYFVDKLATKIIEVGHGTIEVYPGTYEQFLWSRARRQETDSSGPSTRVTVRAWTARRRGSPRAPHTGSQGTARRHRREPGDPTTRPAGKASWRAARRRGQPPASYEEKKKADAEHRRRKRAADDRARRIAELEERIAAREAEIRELEAQMAAPGFYDEREQAEASVTRHQALMWEVGDLMNQWEALQTQEVSDKTTELLQVCKSVPVL